METTLEALYKAINIFKKLSEALNILYDEKHESCGQGAVFHSLCDYFEKDKRRRLLLILSFFIQVEIKKIIFFRKTVKSLKEPILFKGWKGGR